MTTFAEVQFPSEISYGSKGGPVFSSDIVSSFSGYEQRNINWSQARARYDVSGGIKTPKQWQELISFFCSRRGRAIGFRFKDWSDYQGVNELLGIGDGRTNKFQMVKHYRSGDDVYTRTINKPVNNNHCRIYIDSVLITDGINIDFTTGMVTLSTSPKEGVKVTADFEFDVPVRFDTDHLDLQVDSFDAGSWQNIPLIEVRI